MTGTLIIVVSNVLCLKVEVIRIGFECCTVAFLGELVVIEAIVIIVLLLVLIVILRQVLVVILVFVVKLVLSEFHSWLLSLWFLFCKDSLYPCALGYFQNLETIVDLLLVETTWLVKPVLW